MAYLKHTAASLFDVAGAQQKILVLLNEAGIGRAQEQVEVITLTFSDQL